MPASPPRRPARASAWPMPPRPMNPAGTCALRRRHPIRPGAGPLERSGPGRSRSPAEAAPRPEPEPRANRHQLRVWLKWAIESGLLGRAPPWYDADGSGDPPSRRLGGDHAPDGQPAAVVPLEHQDVAAGLLAGLAIDRIGDVVAIAHD